MEDQIALSWDEDFRAIQGTFFKYDFYHLLIGGPYTSSYATNPAEIASQGIWWYAHLSGATPGQYNPVTELYGYGCVRVRPEDVTSTGDMQFYLNYLHDKNPLIGFSISIGPFGSVSFSGGGYDQLATWIDHEWGLMPGGC